MKQLLSLFVTTLLLILSFSINAATSAANQKIGNGFTYYSKDFQLGSKAVLVVEKTIPPRMVNPGVAAFRFGVDQSNVSQNLDALEQFIDLVAEAKKHGETLSHDLGVVRAFNYGIFDYWNHYEIVTTIDAFNQISYALKITPATKTIFEIIPTAVDPVSTKDMALPFQYSLEEVKSIISLLSNYKDGKINNDSLPAVQTGASGESGSGDSLLEKTADFQKGKTTLGLAKKILGEPVQSMGMPDDSVRLDYSEPHSGQGQSISVILIFDSKELLKEKMIVKW